MSLVLVPSEDFTLQRDGVWYDSNIILDPVDEHVIASVEQADVVEFTCSVKDSIESDYVIGAFVNDSLPFSISNEKQMWFNARSSLMPSELDKFEILFTDKNNRQAHIRISDDDIVDSSPLLMDSMVMDKGFNKTFVSSIGVHIKFKDEKEYEDIIEDLQYDLVVDKLAFSSAPVPHYCQPQEVIDFLGVRNNDGSVFEISNSTNPSYDTVAQIICQAENAIEMATRTSWTVRRATNEIRNTGSNSWGAASGTPYMGLFQPSTYFTPTSTYFRGIWCQLIHKNAKDIDGTKGDKIEIRWFGDTWRDITDSGMYWMDNAKGAVYIRQWFFQKDASVRVTYRYGLDEVPEDMKRAAILFTAKHILQTSQLYRFLFPENPESENRWQQTAISFQYEYDKLIRSRVDQTIIGGI